MYADDILLYKSINCLEDYRGLRGDINVIYECTSACHLPLNPLKCKYTRYYGSSFRGRAFSWSKPPLRSSKHLSFCQMFKDYAIDVSFQQLASNWQKRNGPIVARIVQARASHKYSLAALDYLQFSDPLSETALVDIMQNTILNDKFLCLVASRSLLVVVAANWILSAVIMKIVLGSLQLISMSVAPRQNNAK